MKITIVFFTTLREVVGKKEEEIELNRGITVKELLSRLSQKYGKDFVNYVYDEKGDLHGYLQFLVNGKSVTTLQGLTTRLKDGDKIDIIPPVGGG